MSAASTGHLVPTPCIGIAQDRQKTATMQTRVNDRAAGTTRGGGCKGVQESNALASEPVDIWRLHNVVAITTAIVFVLVVRDQQQNIAAIGGTYMRAKQNKYNDQKTRDHDFNSAFMRSMCARALRACFNKVLRGLLWVASS
jgi:hypothetical protein